jgi:glutamate racemase
MGKIGICDWGIGGIGMMQQLQQLNHFDIVYLSDAGFTPYGKVSEIDLKKRWAQVKSFFKEREVTQIAIACNALSTVVEDDANFITVIESGIAQVKESKYNSIGVTGGYRTIESGAYLNTLTSLGFEVKQSVGQVLSALVETGDLTSTETKLAIEKVFEPLTSCDIVLLACTHYPVLSAEIIKCFPKLELLDPAYKMAQTVAEHWSRDDKTTKIEWNTTGDIETMMSSARICFNEKIENPIKVTL